MAEEAHIKHTEKLIERTWEIFSDLCSEQLEYTVHENPEDTKQERPHGLVSPDAVFAVAGQFALNEEENRRNLEMNASIRASLDH